MFMRMTVGMIIMVVMLMFMLMAVSVFMVVNMKAAGSFVTMVMMVVVAMLMVVVMWVVMVMIVRQVNIEFHPVDGRLLLARNMQVIAVELELFQLAFQAARIHAQVQQRGDEHVARNAADKVEVKNFHFIQCSGGL